jgi:hypothetical protein
MADIIFTDVWGIPEEFDIRPASTYIPEWYKKMESYIGGAKKPTANGGSPATLKKCVPVFDAITAGYIIVSPADVYVTQVNGEPTFQWSNFGLIEFHPLEQAPEHPHRKGIPAYPKWLNPWAIKTPKGYSTLFVQPFHRESVFTILPGIVDTDTYFTSVNFPFVLNDPKFEGLIPAGTPIAQVIPFKRESWKLKKGNEKDFIAQSKNKTELSSTFFNRYKLNFWHKKEYK